MCIQTYSMCFTQRNANIQYIYYSSHLRPISTIRSSIYKAHLTASIVDYHSNINIEDWEGKCEWIIMNLEMFFGCKLNLILQDIVDARTYDKMRPPRPGGTPCILIFIHIQHFIDLCYISQKQIWSNLLKNTFAGKPTKVEFHVTVMSLDSINEGSMVSHF